MVTRMAGTLAAFPRAVWRNLRLATARGALRRPVHDLTEAELDLLLACRGLRRADLFRPSAFNAPHRNRMSWMLRHYGLTPETTATEAWPHLMAAERACLRCRNVGRCQRWIAWGRPTRAPRVFCPNAKRFEALRKAMN